MTIEQIVDRILVNEANDQRRENAQRGGQSPLAWVLWCMQLGATIRTTSRDAPDARPLPPSVPLPALPRAAHRVASAIAADGQGLTSVAREVGRRRYSLGLPERLGWMLACDAQRGKWLAKLASGDSAPALAGMRAAGAEALALLVATWDVAVEVTA